MREILRVFGTKSSTIIDKINKVFTYISLYDIMSQTYTSYGNGKAC